MWGNNFPNFHSDPFFQPFGPGFNQHPFGMLGQPGMQNQSGVQQRHAQNTSQAMARPDMFMDPFAQMNRMMQEMSRGMTSFGYYLSHFAKCPQVLGYASHW